MAKNNLSTVLGKFSGKKVIVIGDVMLDKYIWGEVSRISPEAPVQVVEALRETYAAGGAANVAANIATLGGEAHMVGITGRDDSRNQLLLILSKMGVHTKGMMVEDDKPTTLKLRILGRNQQLLRVDYEKKSHVHPNIEKKMIEYILLEGKNAHAIVISDYAKGAITPKLMDAVLSLRKKGVAIIIDPKPSHKEWYKGATVITPNHTEACQMQGVEVENGDVIEKVGTSLSSSLNSHVLITRGERGMSIFEKGKKSVHVPTQAREVFDVTGAGDTVIATIALALSSGSTLLDAAILANHAAGIKVGKLGTSAITLDELRKSVG